MPVPVVPSPCRVGGSARLPEGESRMKPRHPETVARLLRSHGPVKESFFLAVMTGWLLSATLRAAGLSRAAAASAILGLALDLVSRAWSRHARQPMPYHLRWILHFP